MFIIFLLLGIVTSNDFMYFDPTLSPGDIYWPSGWVNSPILLSSNNAGLVNLTIICNAQEIIPMGSVVTITIIGYQSLIPAYITPVDVPITDNNIFIFNNLNLNLGTTGGAAYGPIGIIIQESITGQIIAKSASYGSFATVDPIFPSVGLAITQTTPSTIVSSLANIQLNFTLRIPLRKYDYFVIDVNPIYRTSSVLTNFDYSAIPATESLLSSTGVSIEGNSITVYGTQQDILSGTIISVIISRFTLPYFVFNGPCGWTITFYRFGTPTILYILKGDAALVTTEGPIAVSFASTNNYAPGSYVNLLTFMTLTIIPAHAIPINGYINVTLDNYAPSQYLTSSNQQMANSYGDNYLSIDQSISSFTATIPVFFNSDKGQEFTLTALNNINAQFKIIVHLLGNFSDNTTITVLTNDAGNNKIDYTSYYYSSVVTKYTVNNNINFFYYQNITNTLNPVGQSGLIGNIGIYLSIGLSEDLLAGSIITIRMPLNLDSTSAINGIGFGKSTWGYYVIDDYTSTEDFTTSTTKITSSHLKISANTINITTEIDYLVNPIIFTTFALGAGLNLGTYSQITLPIIPSNPYSAYEVCIFYKDSKSGDEFIYSQPLYFSSVTANFSLELTALSLGISGIASQFTFYPQYSWNFAGFSFTIDLTIANTSITASDFGTGLNSGSAYGISTAGNSYLIYSPNQAPHIVITGIPSITQNVSISVVFPFCSLTKNDKYTLSVIVSAVTNQVVEIAMISMMSFNSLTIHSHTDTVFPGYYEDNNGVYYNSLTNPYAISTSDLFNNSLWFNLTSSTTNSPISISFSGNFNISSSVYLTINSGTSYHPDLFLVSQDTSSNYKTIYFQGLSLTNTMQSWAFNNIIASWYEDTASVIAVVGKTAFNNSYALFILEFMLTVHDNSLNFISYHPTNYYLFGPSSTTVDFNISFSLPGPIYSTYQAYIVISIDDSIDVSIAKSVVLIGQLELGSTINSNTIETNIINQNFLTGAILLIKITNVIPPTIAQSSVYIFKSVNIMYTNAQSASPLIYSWDYSPNSNQGNTTFSPADKPKYAVINSVDVFPNTQGAKLVYFTLNFTTPLFLPIGTIITITGDNFIHDINAVQNTWCTYGFLNSITNSVGDLEVTLSSNVNAQSFIIIRKDFAFNNPTSSTGLSWSVKADFQTASILSGASNVIAISYYTVPTAAINSAIMNAEITNVGSFSWHTFTVALSVIFQGSWSIVLDVPHDYDAHVGQTFFYQQIPTLYFLVSQSIIYPDITCYVDHWIITCSGLADVPLGNSIYFSIFVNNPATTTKLSWSMYIIDSSMQLQTAPHYGMTITYSAIPATVLDLHFVSHKYSATPNSTLTFQALISEFYEVGSFAIIEFPKEYDLIDDNGSKLGCSAVYNSDSAINLVSPNSICSVYINTVQFNFIIASAENIYNKNYTTFTIQNVMSLLTGETRSGQYYDANMTNNQLFNVYDFWTDQFMLYTDASSGAATVISTAFTGASYVNLGAAYTGYNQQTLYQIIINENNPISMAQGTFSQKFLMSANTEIICAYKLIITPSVSHTFLVFDQPSYNMATNTLVSFRIGVPTGSPNGIYLISWQFEEISLIPNVFLYAGPRNTKVSVYNAGKIPITIGSISNIPSTGSSLPIPIQLGNVSPFSDITITFFSMYNSWLIFTPASVTFGKDNNLKYFFITLNKVSTIGTNFTYYYSMNGTDSNSFIIKSSDEFTVGDLPLSNTSINELEINYINQISASINIKVDSASLVYWAFGATNVFENNITFSSYEYVNQIAISAIYNQMTNQSSTYSQINSFMSNIPALLNNQTWSQYTYTLWSYANTTYFTGSSIVQGGYISEVYTFSNCIIAGVSYSVYVWSNNFIDKIIASANQTKISPAIPDPAVAVLQFGETINVSSLNMVNNGVALALGISPNRISGFDGLSSGRRLLSSYSLIISGSAQQFITPNFLLSTSIVTSTSSIMSSIASQGLSVSSLSIIIENPVTYSVASLSGTYNLTGTDLITLYFTTGGLGLVCWIIEYNINTSISITSTLIYRGLTRSGGIPYMSSCFTYPSNSAGSRLWNLTIMNVTSGEYVFSSTACNNYPIVPRCLDDAKIVNFSYTWANSISNANLMQIILVLFLIYLS